MLPLIFFCGWLLAAPRVPTACINCFDTLPPHDRFIFACLQGSHSETGYFNSRYYFFIKLVLSFSRDIGGDPYFFWKKFAKTDLLIGGSGFCVLSASIFFNKEFATGGVEASFEEDVLKVEASFEEDVLKVEASFEEDVLKVEASFEEDVLKVEASLILRKMYSRWRHLLRKMYSRWRHLLRKMYSRWRHLLRKVYSRFWGKRTWGRGCRCSYG